MQDVQTFPTGSERVVTGLLLFSPFITFMEGNNLELIRRKQIASPQFQIGNSQSLETAKGKTDLSSRMCVLPLKYGAPHGCMGCLLHTVAIVELLNY